MLKTFEYLLRFYIRKELGNKKYVGSKYLGKNVWMRVQGKIPHWRSSQKISGWMILFMITIKSVLLGSFPLLGWIERFHNGRSVNTTIEEVKISSQNLCLLHCTPTTHCVNISKGLIHKNLQNMVKGVWHLDQWYLPWYASSL